MEGIIFDFLKSSVSLFQYFTDNQIRTIIDESKLLFCEENEAVARFGEENLFLGVVIEGELSASAIGEGGIRKEIRKFVTGDTFGEIALMSQDRMIADIIATKQSKVLRIPVIVFRTVIIAEPAALQHVSKTVVERFRQMLEEPEAAKSAFKQSVDFYGLQLKGERSEKILVINFGSSSIKFAFFDSENESNKATGQV